MEIINNLQWRYATKRFDTEKKLSKQQLDLLLQSINLAATSYGLQPFELIVAEDSSIRGQLGEAANNQKQVTEASHVFVFAAKTDISNEYINSFVERISEVRKIPLSELADFRTKLINSMASKSKEDRFQWAARQAYISLGFLLSAAAMEKIDACPMEGFDRNRFDEILGLKEKGLASVVMATLGFRSPEDKYSTLAKVRMPLDRLVTVV
jgi:nitroreductase / dihydropteridine reductase